MIRECFELVARCDVCHVESERYVAFTKSGPPPPPWIRGKRWNISWSALLDRDYCSQQCSDRESHGLTVVVCSNCRDTGMVWAPDAPSLFVVSSGIKVGLHCGCAPGIALRL